MIPGSPRTGVPLYNISGDPGQDFPDDGFTERRRTLTVREWFRLQRAVLWNRDCLFAADLDRLTDKVVKDTPLDRLESLHPHKLIFDDADGWGRANTLLERIRAQMEGALWEIEREMQRRATIDRHAEDLLQ